MSSDGVVTKAGEVKEISLIVKNPSRPGAEDFKLKVPAEATILALKDKLEAEYDGKPAPATQTLIYAGRVLKDDQTTLRAVLGSNADLAATHNLHLVVKGAVQQAAPTPAPALQQAASTRATQSATSTSRSRPSSVNATTSNHGQTPAGSQSMLHQHPFLQASYASSGWPASQPDPTILAAYNAALESLRNRPPFPSGPQSSGAGPASNAAGNGNQLYPGQLPQGMHGQAAFMPPFSIAPTVVIRPAMSNGHLVGRPLPAAGPEGSASSSGASSSSGPQLQAPPAGQQGLRVPQLYAPALTYVPVNLVQQNLQQSSQPQSSQAAQQAAPSQVQAPTPGQQPQPLPQQQPLFPYPHFAPMVPMMMPFGFNPYAPQMFPGNPYPHAPAYHQPQQQPAGQPQDNAQPQPGQAFRGMLHAPAPAQGAGQVGVARLARPGQVRVRLIRVNIKLLLQLCVLGFIIYQNTPHGRFVKLVGGALALYFLWPMMNRDNAVRRRIQRLLQPMNPAGGAPPAGPAALPAGRPDGAPAAHRQQPGQPAALRQQQQPRGGNILHEIQALVVGFFTSLLPGFNMNAEDAAAFAQAQQIVAQEAAAQGGARDHMD